MWICFCTTHALGLSINTSKLAWAAETTTTGAGMEFGFAVRRYLDLVVDTEHPAGSEPRFRRSMLGELCGQAILVCGLDIRGEYFALKVTLAPGFASYSRTPGLLADAPLSAALITFPPLLRCRQMFGCLRILRFGRRWSRC